MTAEAAAVLFVATLMQATTDMNIQERLGSVVAVDRLQRGRLAETYCPPTPPGFYASACQVRYSPSRLRKRGTYWVKRVGYHEACHLLIDYDRLTTGKGRKVSEAYTDRCAEIWLETKGEKKPGRSLWGWIGFMVILAL